MSNIDATYRNNVTVPQDQYDYTTRARTQETRTTPLPTPEEPTVPSTFGFPEFLDSLSELMGKNSARIENIDVVIAELQQKVRDLISKTDVENLNVQSERQRELIQKKIADAQAAAEKMREAAAQRESQSIWDKIKLAFQILGALLAVAAAVVTANPLLMIGAIVAVTLAIDGIVKATTENHMGIAGSIAKAAGASDEEAGKADMGFTIAVAVIGLAVAIGGGVASFFSGGATIANLAKQAATVAQENIVKGLSSLAEVGTTVTTIGAAVVSYEAAKAQVAAMFAQADGMEVDGMLKVLDDMVDLVLQHLMAANRTFDAILDSLAETAKEKGDTFSRAHVA